MAASQENANSNSQEKRSLDLLCDMQTELANAVDSVGGKGSRGFLDNYKFHSAKTVNRVVEGFIFLHKSGRIDSSKFLIRPVIEIMFRLKAVQNKPELFYRIAYSEEMIQDPKWFRSAAERSGITYDESARQKRWQDFKEQFETQFPRTKLAR